MLKKLICLLPALALMLVFVVPVRAGAVQTMQEGSYIGVPYAEISDFQSYNTRDYYIMFNGSYRSDYGSSPRDYNVSSTYLISFNSGDMQIVENDGCFEVTPLTSRGSSGWQATQMFIRYFTNDYSVYNSYYYTGSGDFSWWAFKYDPDAHTVSAYINPTFSWSNPNYVISDVYIFESNCDDLQSGLVVNVDFDPDLSGNVDRRVTSGWTNSTVENLHVTISSNQDIQYCWAIVDSGCSVSFNDGNSRYVNYNGRTFLDSNTDLRYVYITSEWNYCAGTSGSASSAHEARGSVVKVLSPCSWHYLSRGQTQEFDVSFNQMNLSSADDYDVVVYALPSNLDIVSCIPLGVGSALDGYDSNYALNFSEIVEVYRSGFTLLQSTKYDPTDNSFGVYAYDPHGENSFNWDKADAYYTDDGEMVIRDTSIKDFVSGHDNSSWSSWSGSSSGGSDVSNSITTVTKSVSSYFSFLNAVFAYLPNVFSSLLSVAFTALVVLGILRLILRG